MISVAVNDQSGVAEARRTASDLAGREGFTESDAGKVALVATELSTNLIKHGSGGEILVGTYKDNESHGVEILALDKGAGMGNVAACLEDGYSSAGTAGHGLGAVIRQSHFVDIGSWPGQGTAVLARVAPGKAVPTGRRELPRSRFRPGAACRSPRPDKTFAATPGALPTREMPARCSSPTDWATDRKPRRHRSKPCGCFIATTAIPCSNLIDYIHGGLARDARRRRLDRAVTTRRHGRSSFRASAMSRASSSPAATIKRMVSMAGTAGYNARKIQSFDYPFERGLVILYSDGLASSWTVDRYPNLAQSSSDPDRSDALS